MANGFDVCNEIDDVLSSLKDGYLRPIEACINCKHCSQGAIWVKFQRAAWDSWFYRCNKFDNLVHVDYVFAHKCGAFEMKE